MDTDTAEHRVVKTLEETNRLVVENRRLLARIREKRREAEKAAREIWELSEQLNPRPGPSPKTIE